MKNVDIKGIIPAIVTPMNSDETINEQELRNQVNRQIEAGGHGIFPFGTNGEAYILSEDEKVRILEIVVEETKGRVPVYAGTGCISTKDTIRLSKKAKEIGADILSESFMFGVYVEISTLFGINPSKLFSYNKSKFSVSLVAFSTAICLATSVLFTIVFSE